MSPCTHTHTHTPLVFLSNNWTFRLQRSFCLSPKIQPNQKKLINFLLLMVKSPGPGGLAGTMAANGERQINNDDVGGGGGDGGYDFMKRITVWFKWCWHCLFCKRCCCCCCCVRYCTWLLLKCIPIESSNSCYRLAFWLSGRSVVAFGVWLKQTLPKQRLATIRKSIRDFYPLHCAI